MVNGDPSSDADSFRDGTTVQLRFGERDHPTDGTIEFVSPTIDAESGTVRVKIRIDNSRGEYRAGERCRLAIPTP